jgi:hypothetical protein
VDEDRPAVGLTAQVLLRERRALGLSADEGHATVERLLAQRLRRLAPARLAAAMTNVACQ